MRRGRALSTRVCTRQANPRLQLWQKAALPTEALDRLSALREDLGLRGGFQQFVELHERSFLLFDQLLICRANLLEFLHGRTRGRKGAGLAMDASGEDQPGGEEEEEG